MGVVGGLSDVSDVGGLDDVNWREVVGNGASVIGPLAAEYELLRCLRSGEDGYVDCDAVSARNEMVLLVRTNTASFSYPRPTSNAEDRPVCMPPAGSGASGGRDGCCGGCCCDAGCV